MLLRVLGTAAGGGIPQWNCACPSCTGARAHPARRRHHASLAVQATEGRWYIVNATPDIGDQIEGCPPLRPRPGTRRSPVAGLILTDAELDHTLGIARLREAAGLEVLATGAVRDALLNRLGLGTVLGPYTELRWRELPHGQAVPLGQAPGPGPAEPADPAARANPGLPAAPGDDAGWAIAERAGRLATDEADSGLLVEVSAIPVSRKRPRYAVPADSPGPGGKRAAGLGDDGPAETGGASGSTSGGADRRGSEEQGRDGGGWVVALRITDRVSGATALYAPAIATWSAELADAVAEADCVIVDGTFWDEDEPCRAGIGTRTATGMGHLPIVGPGGTAERLSTLHARCLYTHLNNTNPLVDPGAAEHRRLAEWGIEVAADGMVIEL
ncbi:MBL fold metallo-hydrolase [Streptomyces zagrosensis]|uniref:Coenzyme PQQ synthesis protein B n=1 Tax=Streptomyces zagrosensis TaxID=1042984 RepID=A0A7W9QH01_9ACTN|nr:MBL fold metallo-hydrolase [Streptomyces zagrosensis]MBB5939784.1 pyrroloquinoline quinone biosynthesis protein B [Streptomyces zagrosensis]